MKTKRVLRYYCDHCHKGGCGKAAMIRHEQRCVRNPRRVCGFCAEIGAAQRPIEELLKAFDGGDVEKLREATDGCPACMLATIVQSRIQDDDTRWIDFNYKEEVAAYWSEKQDQYRPAF